MALSPKTFSMPLTPHVEAVLVFDASDAEATGEYTIYSIGPDENERFIAEWDAMKESLAPTGRVPVTDVVRDDTAHVIRVLTYGIERFAAT